jgi:putative RNA 2'-phosphotransferase
MKDKIIGNSRFISKILRHQPDLIGLTLDKEGWANIDELIYLSNIYQKSDGHEPLTKSMLDEIVSTNNKKRFEYSECGWKIRARQGHSISVDLNYKAIDPPQYLYHGTATKFIPSIKLEGIKKNNRHHVHLSTDEATAISVGKRHGKPYVLKINCWAMRSENIKFYKTENDVWLTDYVHPQFIDFIWFDKEKKK